MKNNKENNVKKFINYKKSVADSNGQSNQSGGELARTNINSTNNKTNEQINTKNKVKKKK